MEKTQKEIITKIKQKKELSDIPDSLVKETLSKYMPKNKSFSSLTKKDISIIIKETRAQLRNYTGKFQASMKKRQELLKKGKISELLETHASTKERLQDYPKLIKIIKKINPSSILDLGCGLNPIALAKHFPNTKYHALDIKEDELKLIETFFQKNKITGDIHCIDVRKVKKFPKVNLCLIFKLFYLIEPNKRHKHTTEIMKKLQAQDIKHFIVSFSTRTLSGKQMTNSRRLWFERLCKTQKPALKYKIIKTPNEIFYVIGH